MDTVLSRAMKIETSTSRGRVNGPHFIVTIRFKNQVWEGEIEARSVEDALRFYDRYQPGVVAEIPAPIQPAREQTIPDEYKLYIIGVAAAMILFFLLPALWMFGVRNWFTNPARLALLFGLGALAGAAFAAQHTFKVQSTWRRVDASIVNGRGLERLDALGAEVTMNDYSRTYLGSSYDVVNYTFNGVNYEYAITGTRTTPPCQRGETCAVLVDPAAPTEIANIQPLDASTFAGAIALAGMGLVFTLVGLFV